MHYFENDENVKSDPKEIKVKIKDNDFTFKVDNGVFSKKGLDFGTRTLLENLPIISGEVLDFGCGYGPIGIFISKMYNASVDMIDINKRALGLALENAKLNKISVNAFESDIYENINKKYDFIVSNPPIRVGKEILYKILFEARNHLKENGQLWIVINKSQGAKSLMADLEVYYDVELIKKNKGFYIIKAVNR